MAGSDERAEDRSLPAPDRAGAPVVLAHEPSVRLGALSIEPALRCISHDDGRDEIVEPRVMQVLVALVRARGQILSRNDLLASCWHGVVVGEDAIDRVIGRVRRLADGIGEGQFTLQTITKVGYRLLPAERPDEAPKAAPADPLLGLKPSICVLPFANMSDDPQQDYFSDGITDDIITDLTKVSALFVVARTTAFTFRGRDLDVPAIARQLGVSHVLEGSVRKAGGRVRVTAQLIDGATGGPVWAERYDRELEDIFGIQDEISEAIVEALKLNLLPEEKQAIEHRGTLSLEAYNLYLLARQACVNSTESDERAAEAIIRICRRTVEIDPAYAQAWALMAIGEAKLRHVRGSGDGGLGSAERAIDLDSDLAEAHAIRARILSEDRRIEESSAALALALRLDPDSYEVRRSAGCLMLRKQRFSEAALHWERATRLLPTDVYCASMLICTYKALGDEEAMARAARLTLQRADMALGKDANNASVIAYSAYALAALGEAGRAKERMQRAELIDPDNLNRRYNFACALAVFLDEKDAALDVLETVFPRLAQGFFNCTRTDPDLDPLRGHPRFQGMLSAAESRLAARA